MTIHLSDEKHERLRLLAERRKLSRNKLIDELSTLALADFDAAGFLTLDFEKASLMP